MVDRRSLPPFAALRAFEAVFRLGGVRKAANDLGISHAVVSRHLSHLEEWLGTALVIRSGPRVTLTPAGERYHAQIAGALADIAAATNEISGQSADRKLQVCSVAGLSIKWLSRELVDFEKRYPAIKVDLRPSDTPANLQAHQADVNIIFHRDCDPTPPGGKGLIVQELARPKQFVVVNPALAEQLKDIAGPKGLLSLPLLHRNDQEDWRTWLSLNGLEPPDDIPGPQCWHVTMAIENAKVGRGALITVRFVAGDELDAGELVELKVPGTQPVATGSYVFVAREDRWSTAPVSALRRFLRERMQAYDGGGSPAK